MSKIIDIRGDEHVPLLGRLRGVTARHELRETVTANDHNYFVAHDAHMVFRDEVPAPLPDLISTSERQLVVSKRLAKALRELDPELELVPVRLVDRAGKTIKSDHAVAVVKTIAQVTPASDDMGPRRPICCWSPGTSARRSPSATTRTRRGSRPAGGC